jgi:signal transduction histidine kinase
MDIPDRLRHALNALPDPVRILGEEGRVFFRNDAASKLFPEGMGHLCARKEGEIDPSCPSCQIDAVLRNGATRRWHVAVPRPGKEDSRDYYEVTLCPVQDGEGRVVAVLESLRDVTATLGLEQYLIGEAERQEEEIRRRAVELESLTERASSLRTELGALRETQTEILFRDRLMALGRLVAGVAHEVHTPLGAILSSTDLLKRSVGRIREVLDREDCDRESCEALLARLDAMGSAVDLVDEGSRRIEQVIRTLRVYSRLDEADLMTADLHEGLDSTIALARYRMGDRIRVVREYGDIPPVTCRPDALNQVFMNLLLNAVQAIPGEGEIVIRTAEESGMVRVEISDTGEGIDRSHLPHIFDLGYTTKNRGEGSGLGLAICKRIIEDHSGVIEVTSSAGEGTKFTVRIPVSPAGTGPVDPEED